MPSYRVKPGHYHYHKIGKGKPRLVDEGEIVEMTRSQYLAFRDKFEPVEEAEQKAMAPKPMEQRRNLRARHYGAGRYHVYNDDSGARVTDEYINKEEADLLVEQG